MPGARDLWGKRQVKVREFRVSYRVREANKWGNPIFGCFEQYLRTFKLNS